MEDEGFGVFKKLIHWGPLTAIGIIKSITIMSLYMNSMWWPASSMGGFINQSLFLILSALTGFTFMMSSVTGPKFLPLKWRPKNPENEKYLQYCSICEGFKAPRSHHCRKCERCVIKMDHHCPWINSCVGWANHCYFTSFLALAVIGSIHAVFILCGSLYAGLHRDYYLYYGKYHLANVRLSVWSLILTVFNIGLSIGVVIAVGMLLFFQLRAIITNRTGIEDWILEKAKYRRDGTNEKFIYPYDLGTQKNIQQVLNLSCSPVGNGIDWAINEDCDQYTLTREQLEQKLEKRARTRIYSVIKKATGSWVPISHGCQVLIHPPLTDEPRIKLCPGDTVKVTRWRKYWLFGEKIEKNSDKTTKPKRVRGWFPRNCAVELTDESEEQQQHFNDKKIK